MTKRATTFERKAHALSHLLRKRAKDKTENSPSLKIIAAFAERRGYRPRKVEDEEILQRLLYPMINEGARILEEGIAQRASDIDVVWLNGYGWPAATGGPMFWADTIGLQKITAGLEAHADKFGTGFVLSPMLSRLAAAGESLV